MVAMSYPRYELVTAVWNGLESNSLAEIMYDMRKPWIGILYAGNPRFR